jgi:hypothetical protein
VETNGREKILAVGRNIDRGYHFICAFLAATFAIFLPPTPLIVTRADRSLDLKLQKVPLAQVLIEGLQQYTSFEPYLSI